MVVARGEGGATQVHTTQTKLSTHQASLYSSFNPSHDNTITQTILCGEDDDSVVWKALNRDASWCAIKILKAPISEVLDKSGVPKEVSMLSILSEPGHPNLLKYYGWGKVNRREMTEQLRCFTGDVGIFVVMEWVEGEILESKITKSSFGRNKRKDVCRQLLEVVQYMHAKNISHGGLFLNNMKVSKASPSSLPTLAICNFTSLSNLSVLPIADKEARVDKDCCQCGGILLSLFSSANLHAQIITNQLMLKEIYRLARDLIDARRLLSLEDALQTPFLNQYMPEDKFTFSSTAIWNDEIVANVANYIISTGSVKDFVYASLVCKQFFVVFQRRLLCTPQFPHLAHPPDYKRNPLGKLLFDAEVAECSMWFERIPYVQDWGTLMAFEDKIFEVELLDAYFEGATEHVFRLQDLVTNLSETNQPWHKVSFHYYKEISVHFNDVFGQSSYTGQLWVMQLALYARGRAWVLSASPAQDFQIEKDLYLRIIAKIRECIIRFNKEAQVYAKQNGLTLYSSVNVLM